MRYSEIRDIDSLDKACLAAAEKSAAKKAEVLDSLKNVRESCTAARLLALGLRGVSSSVPYDRIVLAAIRFIKSRL